MRILLLTAATVLSIGFSAVAQCPVKDVTFSSYGAGCGGPFPNRIPRLGGVWFTNPRGCGISLWMDPYPGCCGTSLSYQFLVIGLAPTNIPLPGMGQGCALLATPTVVFPFGRTVVVTRHWLPKGIALGAVYVQGVLQYQTAVSYKLSYSWTQGMKITLR